MTKKFLASAQVLGNGRETKELYRDWASSYDEEISENGYASPQRVARALVECGANLKAPVLDIGCGTGISGLFLKHEGFTELVGSDFSPEMLALAKEKKVYEQLVLADLQNPFSFISEPPKTVTAVGVMAPGHAKPALISSVVDIIAPEGLFAFSLNDHTLRDPGYLALIDQLVMNQVIRIRWKEYGDHLPGAGIKALIVVLEKLQ
ncbi:MAG: methyltransferase domain-containing protein [Pseudomonadota bacterium]